MPGLAKRKKAKPGAPKGRVFRSPTACQSMTRREGSVRKRIVVCDPQITEARPKKAAMRPKVVELEDDDGYLTAEDYERAPVSEGFIPHRMNELCACNVSYKDFRSGWTFKDAYEHLAWQDSPQGPDAMTFRPSKTRILRHMGKLKRAEWERHQQACAQGQSEPDPWDDYVRAEDFADDLDGLGRLGGSRWWVALGAVALLAGLVFWRVRPRSA